MITPPKQHLNYTPPAPHPPGLGGGFESFPVAMHHNARANGTMTLTAMFNSPGVKGLQIYQLNPYNSTERAPMVEYVPVRIVLCSIVTASACMTAPTSST